MNSNQSNSGFHKSKLEIFLLRVCVVGGAVFCSTVLVVSISTSTYNNILSGAKLNSRIR